MRRRCLNVYSAYDGLALEVLLIQPKKGVKVKGVVVLCQEKVQIKYNQFSSLGV